MDHFPSARPCVAFPLNAHCPWPWRQLVLMLSLSPPAAFAEDGPAVRRAEMAGYLLVPNEKVPETYNAGFSMYVAAWPLLKTYPGHRYQTGLFGTWMFAQYDGPAPAKFYSDVEGGLGWWRDTRFPTETPKFIMGGVGPDFSEIANGPGARRGHWEQPRGLYGVAQLSPWLLFPIDGLNLKQGTCGELFGYGYLPLPLTGAKPTTAGKDVPTGDNCWTLFLNTGNFKGPVAFFTPYFWSHGSVVEARAGRAAAGQPPLRAEPHRADGDAVRAGGAGRRRQGRDLRPHRAGHSSRATPTGDSLLVHRITSYNRKALWDAVKAWFDGGAAGERRHRPAGRPPAHLQRATAARPGRSTRPGRPRRRRRRWTGSPSPRRSRPTRRPSATTGTARRSTKDDSPPGPLVDAAASISTW